MRMQISFVLCEKRGFGTLRGAISVHTKTTNDRMKYNQLFIDTDDNTETFSFGCFMNMISKAEWNFILKELQDLDKVDFI
jgi:hypothetical protein